MRILRKRSMYMNSIIKTRILIFFLIFVSTNILANEKYLLNEGDSLFKLRKYVEIMVKLYPSGKNLNFGKLPYNDISLKKGDFSIKNLSVSSAALSVKSGFAVFSSF